MGNGLPVFPAFIIRTFSKLHAVTYSWFKITFVC